MSLLISVAHRCNFPFGFLFNGGVFYFFSLLPPLGRRTKGKLHPGIACLFMVAHQFSATANNKKRWLNNERQIRNRHEIPFGARRRNICWARLCLCELRESKDKKAAWQMSTAGKRKEKIGRHLSWAFWSFYSLSLTLFMPGHIKISIPPGSKLCWHKRRQQTSQSTTSAYILPSAKAAGAYKPVKTAGNMRPRKEDRLGHRWKNTSHGRFNWPQASATLCPAAWARSDDLTVHYAAVLLLYVAAV